MTAISSKGVNISLTSKEASEKDVPINKITAGTDRQIKVQIEPTAEPKIGDVVKFNNTGFAFSNKPYAITDVVKDTVSAGNPQTYTLTIGNLPLGSGALATGASLDFYDQADDICMCFNSFSISKDTPSTISVGTYCDPSASLPSSSTTAGTVSFGGYIKTDEADYPELVEAEAEGTTRICKITLPQNQGFIVMPIIVASIVYDIPLDGGLGYTGTGTLTSNSIHNF